MDKKRKPQILDEALAQLEAAEEKIWNQACIIKRQEAKKQSLTMELIRVNEEFRLQLAHRFARHSEKYYPNQPNLFDELEENVIQRMTRQKSMTNRSTRKKQ